MATRYSKMHLINLLFLVIIAPMHYTEQTEMPSFTTDFPSVIDFTNSSGGRILCSVDGEPQPTTKWLLSDDSPVDTIPGLRRVMEDGSLVFYPFSSEKFRQDVHAIGYKCLASSTMGSISSNVIRVKGVVIQPFDVYVHDVYAIRGNSALMRCSIPSFMEKYISVIAWMKDSKDFIASSKDFDVFEKYILLPSGDLYVRNIEPKDEKYSFNCQMKHRLTGEIKSSIKAGKFIVSEPKDFVPIQIQPTQTEVTLMEGDSILLVCVANGYPTPKYSWKKMNNYGESRNIDATSTKTKIVDGLLYISKSNVSDAGTYVCIASNDDVNQKMSFQINIRTPLQVNVVPRESTVDYGDEVNLECKISGQPISQIKWLKNGYPMTSVDGLQMDNKTLIISNMAPQDAGFYQCFAKNAFQSAFSVALLKLGDTKPKVIKGFDERLLSPGDEIDLKCIFSGRPKPEVIWSLDNVEISSTTRISIDTNHNSTSDETVTQMTIAKSRTEDGGVYSCSSENLLGKAAHRRRITIRGKIGIRSIRQVQAVSETNVQLNCPFYGSSFENIKWKKDSVEILYNPRQLQFKNGSLVIRNVQPKTDKGKYECFVTNKEGKILKGEINLDVIVLAKIVPFSFQEEQIREGTRARIQCVVSEGDTPIRLTWLKDNRPIPSELGVTTRDLDEFSTILMISAITPRHNGNYTCVASNAGGQTQHTAPLFVNVPPKILPFVFQDDQFFKGMRAYIVCAVSQGDLPIRFQWLKDGLPIPHSLGVITRNIDSHANSLSIESVASPHTGNYTCISSNEAGTMSHSAQLLVQVAPRIVPFHFNTNTFEGNNVRITCAVDQGDLPLTFHWMKEGTIISNSERISSRTIDEYSNILTIGNVKREHSGNYTCLVNNSAAIVKYSSTLTVYVPPKIVPFAFQEEHLLEGMLVRVTCVVSRGDLPLIITWLKDNEPIPSELNVSTRDFDEYSSILSIDPVSRNHSGNYTCVTKNEAGVATYSALLVVHVSPQWTHEPENIETTANSDVLIHCQAEGFPKPNISWENVIVTDNFAGESIPVKTNHKTQVYSNGTLAIKFISKDDEGYYVCMAANGIGESLTKTVRVTVRAAPIFLSKFVTVTVKKGEEINVLCKANGNLPIHYSWSLNGSDDDKKLDNSRYQISTANEEDNASRLVIPHAAREDSLTLLCKAKNTLGEDDKSFKIVVQETPDSPVISAPKEAINQTIELRWEIPYDGNDAILKYVIQYKKQEEKWNETKGSRIVGGNATSVILNGLQPATYFQFRMYAENSIGRGKMSKIITLKTDDSVPTESPRNLQLESINSNTLRVLWKPPLKNSWNGTISGYKIGYKEHQSSKEYDYKQLEVPEDYTEDLVYQLTNLKMYTQYSIIVRAYNNKGIGPRSEPVLIMTSEGVPSAPPRDIRCSPLSSTSVYILWDSPLKDTLNGVLRGYKIVYNPVSEWTDNLLQKTKVVNGTKLTLQELEVNTNYTVEILAYTKMGDGVKSKSVYCKTYEDGTINIVVIRILIPEAPVQVKALASSSDSVIVSWKPSKKINGIVTKYNVYYKAVDNENWKSSKDELLNDASVQSSAPETHFLEIKKLKKQQLYAFWVKTASKLGESLESEILFQRTTDNSIGAKSASFDDNIKTPWKKEVVLLCKAVGIPQPRRKWLQGIKHVEENERITIRTDGALTISSALEEDRGNYTCIVYNDYGQDETIYHLHVMVPPSQPKLEIIFKSQSSIQLQWKVSSNGGDRIRGYILHYKRENGQWNTKDISPDLRLFTLDNLACGAAYQIYIEAFNSIDTSSPSDIITVLTEGSALEPPMKKSLIQESSTFVTVHLNAWPTTGCPVMHFGIEYRVSKSKEWTVVSHEISPAQKNIVISGLSPSTWHVLRFLVETSGETVVYEYKFATLSSIGGTIPPEAVESASPKFVFHVDPFMFIPAVALLIIVIVSSIVICIYYKKRNAGYGSPSVYSDRQRQMKAWIQKCQEKQMDGYNSSERRYSLSHRRKIDPIPYAMSCSSDVYPENFTRQGVQNASSCRLSPWKQQARDSSVPHSEMPAPGSSYKGMFNDTLCPIPKTGVPIQETTFVFPVEINHHEYSVPEKEELK